MSFFSSATKKRKRDSDDSDESQPGPSTPKKTSSDIYNDTTSISCKRSVCDPLKLKMTPKVNYLGVTMTPEIFFEGKTLDPRMVVVVIGDTEYSDQSRYKQTFFNLVLLYLDISTIPNIFSFASYLINFTA